MDFFIFFTSAEHHHEHHEEAGHGHDNKEHCKSSEHCVKDCHDKEGAGHGSHDKPQHCGTGCHKPGSGKDHGGH
ncbi:unnamed protein product [Schistosoma mattheei]|uniref:Uncharacterized protein n=1 Tax=Schistosoma mattheei TaxID=31246 RepID=A0A3P8CED6_9TREM|nr:unnamed protein product [Schistosoma mattheei]